MSIYQVELPIEGTAVVWVRADSEAEAIAEAVEVVTSDDFESWHAESRGAVASTEDEEDAKDKVRNE